MAREAAHLKENGQAATINVGDAVQAAMVLMSVLESKWLTLMTAQKIRAGR
jgi:hypothetical protein